LGKIQRIVIRLALTRSKIEWIQNVIDICTCTLQKQRFTTAYWCTNTTYKIA